MQAELTEYLPILVFLGVAIVLAIAMILGSFMVARQAPDPEKLSSYECGFEPFGDSRKQFDVRFYLVAILFILFDVELVFLYPWAVIYRDLGMLGLVEMGVFLGILVVGFVYAWDNGALEWQ